ncbi:MAG: hypothetical protein ACTSSI_10810, partial [Candidatus Helarchaeota archaeon]
MLSWDMVWIMEPVAKLLKVHYVSKLILTARALLEKLGKKVEDEMKTCSICGDVFTNLDDFIQIARKKIQEIEFKTFLIGSISVDEIIEKEDQMRANHKLQHGESIKAELNREVGKKMLK